MTELRIAIVAPVLIAAYFALRRKHKAKDPTPEWRFDRWTSGVVLEDGPSFAFPAKPNNAGYLQWIKPPKLRYGDTLTARFKIEGGGFTAREFPDRTPIIGLVIQRKGDNWSAEGEYASYRWYSHATVTLAAGELTLTAALDILDWGPVQGQKSLHLFNQALKSAESIGFTFGSAGGRGHGVYATQQSRFTLLSLGVAPAGGSWNG